ncbi:MAG: hypothetical protein KDC38_09580 [Planctomycetes bacterium]|nr:hypothetical protein [Planctomycetota bacterium]
MTDATGPSGSIGSVEVLLTHVSPANVVGWSLGVCHDPIPLDIEGATSGATTQTVFAGGPPDFELITIVFDGTEPPGTSPGVNHGVVFSFLGLVTLPPGTDYELLVIDYAFAGPAGTVTELTICDDTTSGGVPISTVISCTCAVSPAPITFPGTITIADPMPFMRGDCNDDGLLDLSDVVTDLAYAFAGGTVPSCLDACDANDDGRIDVSDAVALLAWLFTPGTAPLPPPSACGIDPTTDALDCAASVSCP